MVLVTGATGILGRTLILELLKKGEKVRATKRANSNLQDVLETFENETNNSEIYFSEIEWVDVDFDDLDSLRLAINGIDEIYHCAGKVSFDPRNKKDIFHTNVEGTKNILYIANELKVKKILFVSSSSVFDKKNNEPYEEENSEFNPKIPHSFYAQSKYLSEMEAWRASAEGQNIIIINPGIIIGSGNWTSSSGNLFTQIRKNPYSFPGITGYVDVRDVAKIAIELMEKNLFGERFAIVSENKSYIEISRIVRKMMNLKEPKIFPKSILKIIFSISSVFKFFIPKLKMLNQSNINALYNQSEISNEKIKKELNYQFIPIEESLRFHLKNYLKHQENKK